MSAATRIHTILEAGLTTPAAIEGALGLPACSLSGRGSLDAADAAKVDQLLAAYRIEIQKVNARIMRDRIASA